MELNEQKRSDGVVIQSYTPGAFKINGQNVCHSIVLDEHNWAPWRPKNLDDIKEEDISALFKPNIDLILVGTGNSGQVILPPRAMKTLVDAGVPYECMSTASACRTWVLLSAESRNVIAALLI